MVCIQKNKLIKIYKRAKKFIRGWHGILSNAFYLPDVLLENTYDNGKWIKSTDIIWEQGNLFNINEDSLYYTDLINLEVKLDDDVLDEKYLFLEEFHNTTLYNINLSEKDFF